ncbi:MAG: carbon-nitrogen hydrolase family protein [Marinagarivorans sp.]|nr:carbon-nitrogen hydrolase family protein [Marinagarivorans sp.]
MNSSASFIAAVVQMISSPRLEDNLTSAKKLIQQAALQGANLVVLPENFALLGNTLGRQYGCAEELPDAPIRLFLSRCARDYGIWLIGGTTPRVKAIDGIAEAIAPKTFAASHAYNPRGEEVGRYDKIHLFDANVKDSVGTYRESDAMAPGSQIGMVDTEWGALGLSVCYDLRFPEYFRLLQQQGMHFLAVPSAFTYSTGEAHWEVLLRARAIENQCYVFAANQGGWHNGTRRTYGHSCIIDPWGTVISVLPEGEGIALAEINLQFLSDVRKKMPVFEHRKL